MTFNQIVWKMAKYHYKKYIFYLICNSLAVMFFFMFTTLFFNDQLIAMKQIAGIQYVLTIPGIALVLFTVFFISYAHHIFIKRRRSEFGLFMTLGMTNRDISKLVLLENGVIAGIALIIGILSGMLFSKFFFWLLLKGVGIQGIAFHLNAKMFIYSIVAFLAVFIVAVGQSLYVTMKSNVIQNLKNEKVTENITNKNPIIGGIGLFIVIGSIIGLYLTYTSPQGGDYLLLWALATFIGLYIALYQLMSFFIKLVKKNKSFYYRRLLYFTNMDYKYKQLTSIMMVVTVMIMVTILYSTIILFTYISTEKEAIENNPYDVGFIQTGSKNNLAAEEIYSIFEQHGNAVQEHISLPIYTFFQMDYYGYIDAITFMSLEGFNMLTSRQLTLQDNEFIYYLNDDTEIPESTPYDYGLRIPNDGEITHTLKEVIAERNLNLMGNLSEVLILNESELEILKGDLDGFDAVVHLMNVENWQESATAVNALEQAFRAYNEETSAMNVENMPPEDEFFQIASRVDGYERNKNSNGLLFFVTIFLSILFFAGSFFLLYIQLFSEVDKETEKIRKLHRIGMTQMEIKKMISQEITTIFMMPTILGTILALLYIVAMATDIGGVIENPAILFYFLIITVTYFIIPFIFLLYARKKIFLQLIDKGMTR